MKEIFVINGSGGVGKNTFVETVNNHVASMYRSSVDIVKKAAKVLGWKGGKTEKDRKFLSDLKFLSSEYNDQPYASLREIVSVFYARGDMEFLFLDIREPDEIDRAVKEFNTKTILVKRNCIPLIDSNEADRWVFHYKYDYIIENNGSLDDLDKEAEKFIYQVHMRQRNKKG